jgi:hypothetical protein
MRASGFAPMFFDGGGEKGWLQSWALARALPSSVHMYLTGANAVPRCLLDPACVRPADYRPSPDASLRLTANATGVLPAWRVFGVNFWGSRPEQYKGTLQHPCRDWAACDGEWSYHALGNKWLLTPFAYPNEHTHIPMSMEQACRATPVTPPAARRDAVLVLAKRNDYFSLPTWRAASDALGAVKDAVAPTELLTTVRHLLNTTEFPIPPALTELGPQRPEAYMELLSSVRVLLGIGKPEISPTPYEAL